MNAYPLTPLLRVRRIREDAASAEYAASEAALQGARKAALERQKALDDYVAWRMEEEDRRYLSILDRQIPMKALDEFKKGLAALRDKDAELQQALALARKSEEEAGRIREKAFESLRKAKKEKEKINAHQDIWQIAEARENERLADLELEEFIGKR